MQDRLYTTDIQALLKTASVIKIAYVLGSHVRYIKDIALRNNARSQETPCISVDLSSNERAAFPTHRRTL